MPNQYDYRELLHPSLSARYTISRVMAFPTDETIRAIVPAEFGFYPNEYVELCLYNPSDNTFISSQRIDLADNIISVVQLVYQDGSYTNYITIDFSKINELYPAFLIPGVFDLVINVFEDMIGAEDNKKLAIDVISADSTEVRLKYPVFFGPMEEEELSNIINKSIPKPFLGGVTDELLVEAQQTGNAALGITAAEVLARAQQTDPNYIVVPNLHLETNFTEIITRIMGDAHDAVIGSLQTAKYRLVEAEYQTLVTSALTASFQKYVGLFDSRVNVI